MEVYGYIPVTSRVELETRYEHREGGCRDRNDEEKAQQCRDFPELFDAEDAAHHEREYIVEYVDDERAGENDRTRGKKPPVRGKRCNIQAIF